MAKESTFHPRGMGPIGESWRRSGEKIGGGWVETYDRAPVELERRGRARNPRTNALEKRSSTFEIVMSRSSGGSARFWNQGISKECPRFVSALFRGGSSTAGERSNESGELEVALATEPSR